MALALGVASVRDFRLGYLPERLGEVRVPLLGALANVRVLNGPLDGVHHILHVVPAEGRHLLERRAAHVGQRDDARILVLRVIVRVLRVKHVAHEATQRRSIRGELAHGAVLGLESHDPPGVYGLRRGLCEVRHPSAGPRGSLRCWLGFGSAFLNLQARAEGSCWVGWVGVGCTPGAGTKRQESRGASCSRRAERNPARPGPCTAH
mmetsp:Transcript_1880/g.5494  ORF Transcript_1880/g.5494 Transcript_1880/m.5494 type:complete len:206 (-) Transcript_1880:78-695(-)